MVEWQNTRIMIHWPPVRITAGCSFFFTRPWFKSFLPQTFDPPPPPPAAPLKNVIQFQGDKGLKIKKSIGGLFCRVK